jgi:hypothetical protein
MDKSVENARSMRDIANSMRDIAKGMHAINDRLLEIKELLNPEESQKEGDA